MIVSRVSRAAAVALIGATAVFLGCATQDPSVTSLTSAVVHVPDPEAPHDSSPVPSTPEAAVALLQWCWNHRAADRYRDLLTDDFRFTCRIDSGIVDQQIALTREDELERARRLFVSGSDFMQPATRITLQLDSLLSRPDPRPGKSSPWHVLITARMLLAIDTDYGNFRLLSHTRFYLVRADSAAIPAELRARGFRPHPHRWYLERWEDDGPPTGLIVGNRRGPNRNKTFCEFKALYQ